MAAKSYWLRIPCWAFHGRLNRNRGRFEKTLGIDGWTTSGLCRHHSIEAGLHPIWVIGWTLLLISVSRSSIIGCNRKAAINDKSALDSWCGAVLRASDSRRGVFWAAGAARARQTHQLATVFGGSVVQKGKSANGRVELRQTRRRGANPAKRPQSGGKPRATRLKAIL